MTVPLKKSNIGAKIIAFSGPGVLTMNIHNPKDGLQINYISDQLPKNREQVLFYIIE